MKTLIQKRMELLAGRGWYPSLRLTANGTWRAHLIKGGGPHPDARQSFMVDGFTPEGALTSALWEASRRAATP